MSFSKLLEKGKVMIGYTYYEYEIRDTSDLPMVNGIVSNDIYNEVCKKIFIRNQKAIDDKRTGKERRNMLIKVNRAILKELNRVD